MHRRAFLGGSIAAAGLLATTHASRATQATPDASSVADDALPLLEITLTDTGFEFAAPLAAGRQRVVVSNSGTLTDSHFALGKIPEAITDAQYDEWIAAEGEDTDALSFDAIEFVGVPDWPQPGKPSTGVVDIAPGRYFLFDPFAGRQPQQLTVAGAAIAGDAPVPDADVTVTLTEMAIDLPDAVLTTAPLRWKIENTGTMSHEVAIVPVSADFTEEHLQMLFTMPEDATPLAGTPELVYQPVAAIGILAGQHTSWLDVQLAPGRYLAACMLPFGTGYPHAIDGMFRFIDIV